MGLIAKVVDDPVARHVEAIKAILDADVYEPEMGAMLRDYCNEHLQRDQELFCEVHDRLAKDKIISRTNFRALWNA